MNKTEQAEMKTQNSCRDASYRVKRKSRSKKRGEAWGGSSMLIGGDVGAAWMLVYMFSLFKADRESFLKMGDMKVS